MADAIHIHEDDWGMRNLYPLAAADEAAADLLAAAEAGERNRDPSGFGWTDVYMAKPPSITYADVGFLLADAVAALAPIMPRVTRFNATIGSAIGAERRDPYGSYETEAWCFGYDETCFIKLEPDGDFVKSIWLELPRSDADTLSHLRAAIEAIHARQQSCVADYWLSFAGPADQPTLDEYFACYAINEAEADARWQAYRREHPDLMVAAPPPAPPPPGKTSRGTWRRFLPW